MAAISLWQWKCQEQTTTQDQHLFNFTVPIIIIIIPIIGKKNKTFHHTSFGLE
jgi:hypothetical protein